MGLDGVEIICNGSGSHYELRKLYKRVDLIKSATSKVNMHHTNVWIGLNELLFKGYICHFKFCLRSFQADPSDNVPRYDGTSSRDNKCI